MKPLFIELPDDPPRACISQLRLWKVSLGLRLYRASSHDAKLLDGCKHASDSFSW